MGLNKLIISCLYPKLGLKLTMRINTKIVLLVIPRKLIIIKSVFVYLPLYYYIVSMEYLNLLILQKFFLFCVLIYF